MVSPVSSGFHSKTGAVVPEIGAASEKELEIPKEIQAISIKIPKMSSALAAQVLGASHIRGMSLKGEKLIDFVVYLQEHMAQSRFKDVPAVERVLSELDEMLQLESQLRGLQKHLTGTSWGKRAALIAHYLSSQVKKIPVGKTLLLPGGGKA